MAAPAWYATTVVGFAILTSACQPGVSGEARQEEAAGLPGVGDWQLFRPSLQERVACGSGGVSPLCTLEGPLVAAAVDREGRVLVVTMRRGARVLGPVSGEPLPIGRFGHGPDEYEALLAGGFTSDGDVGLFDLTSAQLKYFNSDGAFRFAQPLSLPDDVVAASFGEAGLFLIVIPPGDKVGTTVDARVLKVDPAHHVMTTIAQFETPALSATPRFHPLPGLFQPLAIVSACPGGGAVYAEPLPTVAVGVVEPGAPGVRVMKNLWPGRVVTELEVEMEHQRRVANLSKESSLWEEAERLRRTAPRVHPPITSVVCGEDLILLRESIPAADQDSVAWRVVHRNTRQRGLFMLARDDEVVGNHRGRVLVARRISDAERELAWIVLVE